MDIWNLSGTQSKSYILLFGLSKGLQIRWRHVVVYDQVVIWTQIYSHIKESGRFLVTLKVNNDCDGDRDSYDAMVLLTGRYDFEEIKKPGF